MEKTSDWLSITNLIKLHDKATKCKQEKKYLGALWFFALFYMFVILFFLTTLFCIIVVVSDIFNRCSSKDIEVSSKVIELHREYEQIKVRYRTNPKSLEVKIDSIWKKATSIPITDKSGKKAILSIYTLSNGYYWAKGKNEIRDIYKSQLNLNANSDFVKYINSEYFKKGYIKHNEIICVGNSSFEENGNKSNEECRSYCRALYLRRLLENNMPFAKIDVLPIGISDSSGLSSDLQRSIIIIGVLKVDTLIDLRDALYLHLLKDRNIPFRFWDYSLCKDYDSFYNPAYIPCKNSNMNDIINNK